MSVPSPLDQIAERVERLLVRHEEVQRTNALLQRQVETLVQERDALLSRFAAARMRLDAVLERLPADLSRDVAAPLMPPPGSSSAPSSFSSTSSPAR